MKSFLKKLVPSSVKDDILKIAREKIKENNKFASNRIPKFTLEEKNIKNTKVLLNREEMLKLLPKNGIVAELGVDQGGFSEKILKICNPKKLVLVDYWGTERYNQEKRKNVEQKFKQEIDAGKLEIELGYSTDVGERFDDNFFDWIYIDTDHTYKTTIKELEIWSTKVKQGGIIAGHDFIVGNWDGMVRYGVIEAVYEFCTKYNWEIIYLTMELDIKPSFAIRKL